MNNYQPLQNWLRLPPNVELGNPTGIGMDSHQNIFVFHRAGRVWPADNIMPDDCIAADTILVLDRDSGKLLNSWGSNLFILPHGLKVDHHDNIWLTDVGSHQVFKFNHDGQLLMTLGEAGIPGNDSTHFAYPTDIAITKDGSFYVSDGYGNSRIIKFSAAGEYLFEWGSKGNQEGHFDLPHAIDLDDHENIYVADRENNRIQVFNGGNSGLPPSKGLATPWRVEFIRQIGEPDFGKMSSVALDQKSGGSVAVDFTITGGNPERYSSGLLFFDAGGKLVSRFSEKDSDSSGGGCWYHNVMIDDSGNIYVTDIQRNTILKFVKI